MASLPPPGPSESRRGSDPVRVVRALEELCASLSPGDRIPTHTELMRRFQASERAVLRALEDLRHSGRIVRRNGVGTFVAELSEASGAASPVILQAVADSRTIVAIAPPNTSFYDRCMDVLFRHAEAEELSLVCRVLDPKTTPAFTLPPEYPRPRGFLCFHYDLAPVAEEIQEAGCRVVLIGAPPSDVVPRVPCVFGDHEYGGYLAARHLFDLGHRRIACMGSIDPGSIPLERTRRWRGFQRALREAQRGQEGEVHSSVLPKERFLAWTADPGLAAGALRAPDAPTAIIAWNDRQAAQLLAVLTRAGVKVPGEISLVGYDALPEGELVYPPLTTVDQGIGQQLHVGLGLLTSAAPPPSGHTVMVLPSLLSRQSTSSRIEA